MKQRSISCWSDSLRPVRGSLASGQEASPPSDYVSRAEYDRLKAEHDSMKVELETLKSTVRQVANGTAPAAINVALRRFVPLPPRMQAGNGFLESVSRRSKRCDRYKCRAEKGLKPRSAAWAQNKTNGPPAADGINRCFPAPRNRAPSYCAPSSKPLTTPSRSTIL